MVFDGTAPGLPQLLNNAWLFIFTALQICLSAPGESKYLNIKAGQINVHASTGFKKEGKKNNNNGRKSIALKTSFWDCQLNLKGFKG